MKTKTLSGCLLIAVLAGALSTVSVAQSAAAPKKPAASRPAAPPDDINPGVDTSADDHQVHDTTPSSSAAMSRSAESAAEPAPAPAKSKAAGAKKAAPGTKPQTDKPADKPAAKPQASRLDLDRTDITGNRELPKVMVIVPWKRADLGDVGRPMNSLLDEVLQPIDRDVFQRQTRYYDALKPDAATSAAAATGRANR